MVNGQEKARLGRFHRSIFGSNTAAVEVDSPAIRLNSSLEVQHSHLCRERQGDLCNTAWEHGDIATSVMFVPLIRSYNLQLRFDFFPNLLQVFLR